MERISFKGGLMKKLIYAALLAFLLPSGISGAASLYTEPLPAHVTPLAGEKKRIPALEETIAREFTLEPQELFETSYAYFYLDTDNDGNPEILSLVKGPATSGTGGDTLLVISPEDNYSVRQRLTLAHAPVLVTYRNGSPSLITERYGGGAVPSWVKLENSNGTFDTVNDGKEISIENMGGVAYFADSLTGKGFSSFIPMLNLYESSK